VNVSAEIILGIVTCLCGLLSGAVAKMWLAFTGELKDCNDDRKALHVKTEHLHSQITEISTAVGKLQGRLGQE